MSLVLVRPDPPAAEESLELEAIYEEHHDLVYRLGLRYGSGSAQWAEDLTHDVFVRLFERPDALHGVDNVAAWLYRAATNAALNRLARERFLRAAPVRWLLAQRAEPPDPEALGIVDQRLRRLLAEVSRMPPKEQACFFMYYADSRTQDEIGEILGCTKSYVCKLLGRVRKRLARFEKEAR